MSKSAETRARKAVLGAARAMAEQNLSPGMSGNVSMRWRDGMLITPSAMPYDVMTDDDIVHVAGDGSVRDGGRKPSSEWRFHLAALSVREDCDAVVHTHSRFATVLACSGQNIPAFHYMVAIAGGMDIPLVPYALFGTQRLADHVRKGLKNCRACLMANHGQIALGATPDAALALAGEVETLAAQYVDVLQIGRPRLLSDAAMRDVLKKFESYGR